MKYDYKDMQGWIKGMPRFFVERRIGCIAVIDSNKFEHKSIIPLMEKTPGVVWFYIRCVAYV